MARPSRRYLDDASWTLAVTIALFSTACGGDDSAEGDGGVDATMGADAGTPVDNPWLAVGVPPIALAPCPDGWREVPGDVATCEPYPVSGRASCAPGEAHFLGEPGCRPVGASCPTGGFSDALPTDGSVVFVDDDAAPGGDGSRAAPWSSLDAVPWSALTSGTTVALAKGVYAGVAPLKAGVRLLGACAAETRLTGTALPVAGVVSVTSGGEPARVESLSIVGAPEGAIPSSGAPGSARRPTARGPSSCCTTP